MTKIYDVLKEILPADCLNSLSCSPASIAVLNAAIAALIKTGIPFDVEFTPGTRRIAAEASLTVHITPTTSITVLFQFEPGSTL